MRRAFLAGALLLAIVSSAASQELALRLSRAPGGWLLAEPSADALFDDALLEALESGVPAQLRWRFEVWRARPMFWDDLRSTVVVEYRVLYDVLEDRLRVIDAVGELVFESDSLDEIEALLGAESIELVELRELSPDAPHYVSVELAIEPLSLEEIRELERWLHGSRRARRPGVPGHIVRSIGERLGLGERSRVLRSRRFRPAELESP